MTFSKKNKTLIIFLAALCFIGPLMNSFFALMACGGMHSPYYFVGYETGFGGRKLLGTIFSFILPEYVHHRHLIPFIFGVILMNAILFIVFVYKCLYHDNKSSSTTCIMLMLVVYVISPFSFLRMLSHLSWYADIWLYLAALIFLLLYLNHRHSLWYLPSTLFVVATACLTHHIFCCILFPMFAALFIYDILADNTISYRKGFGYLTICIIIGLLFMAIWFFGNNNMDIDAIYDNVSQHTNCVCTKERLYFHWLYGSNTENIQAMWDVGQFPWRYYQFLPVLILLSPMLALFSAPWIMTIRATKGIEKKKYLLMFLLPTLLIIPMFVVATDYSRWYYSLFFCHIMMLLMLHGLNDKVMDTQLHRLFEYLKKNWLITFLLIVYLSSFSIGACGIDWIEKVPSLF